MSADDPAGAAQRTVAPAASAWTYVVLGVLFLVVLFPVYYGSSARSWDGATPTPSRRPCGRSAGSSPRTTPTSWADPARAASTSTACCRPLAITVGPADDQRLAAYAFVFLDCAGGASGSRVFLSTMMIPYESIIIPNYLLISEARAQGHHRRAWRCRSSPPASARSCCASPSCPSPWSCVTRRRVDGAGHFRFLFSILVPLSSPEPGGAGHLLGAVGLEHVLLAAAGDRGPEAPDDPDRHRPAADLRRRPPGHGAGRRDARAASPPCCSSSSGSASSSAASPRVPSSDRRPRSARTCRTTSYRTSKEISSTHAPHRRGAVPRSAAPAAIAALSLVLAACGGRQRRRRQGPGAPAGRPGQGGRGDDGVLLARHGRQERRGADQARRRSSTQKNQGKIKVKATYAGKYDDAIAKYKAAIQSKSTPDVIQTYDIGTRFMIDAKQTVPMQAFIDRDKLDVSRPAAQHRRVLLDRRQAAARCRSTPRCRCCTTTRRCSRRPGSTREAAGDDRRDPHRSREAVEEERRPGRHTASARPIYGWFLEQFIATDGAHVLRQGQRPGRQGHQGAVRLAEPRRRWSPGGRRWSRTGWPPTPAVTPAPPRRRSSPARSR